MRRALAFVVVVFIGGLVFVVGRAQLPQHLSLASDYGVVPLPIDAPVEVPPTEAGRAVVMELATIQRTTRSSRYAHRTDVDVHAGRYHWDCSGMVGWLLRRHAPRAFAALGRERPVASDFARVIARSSTAPGDRWQRIARIEEVRAGDVFAWRSPAPLRRANSTGHVGIVLATPQHAMALGAVYSVRVADATTLPHELDSRAASADADGGLGVGTMTFVVDAEGAVTHYGWAGVLSPLYVEAPVVFGRLHL